MKKVNFKVLNIITIGWLSISLILFLMSTMLSISKLFIFSSIALLVGLCWLFIFAIIDETVNGGNEYGKAKYN